MRRYAPKVNYTERYLAKRQAERTAMSTPHTFTNIDAEGNQRTVAQLLEDYRTVLEATCKERDALAACLRVCVDYGASIDDLSSNFAKARHLLARLDQGKEQP